MKLTDVTSLGRTPVDPSYPTNLAIAALTMVVTVGATAFRLVQGTALSESALGGVSVGLVVFMTWALGRELDPAHDLSAFAGTGLVLIALLVFDPPSLMVVVWLLLVLRLVNRTTGLPAKPLDSIAVLGLGTWLIWQGHWPIGLLTAVAFLLDGLLSPPLRRHLVASGLAFAITVVVSIYHSDMVIELEATLPVVLVSAVAGGLFAVAIASSTTVHAVGDATREPLNPRRVQATQALALATALLLAWWGGASGVVALLPLWAALFGVGLYRLAILIRSRIG